MSIKRVRLPTSANAKSSLSRWVAELRRMNFVVSPVVESDVDDEAITLAKLAQEVRQQIMLDGW